MFKNAKRTTKNDVILGNNKAISLQNIIAVASLLMAVFYFFSFFKIEFGGFFGESESYGLSGFALTFAHESLKDVGLDLGDFGAIFMVFFLWFLVPAVVFALYVINVRMFNEKRSYKLVMWQYVVALGGGILTFLVMMFMSLAMDVVGSLGMGGMSFIGRLYQILNLVIIIVAVIGIVKTGSMPIDYTAQAKEFISKGTVDKASALAGNLGKKAGEMAVAAKESAEKKAGEMAANAERKAAEANAAEASEDGVRCPNCGKTNKLSVNFCTGCGTSLKEAKEQYEAERVVREAMRAEKERAAREAAARAEAERRAAEEAELAAKAKAAEASKPEKSFCENCGAKLTEGAAFCENCGAKIE